MIDAIVQTHPVTAALLKQSNGVKSRVRQSLWTAGRDFLPPVYDLTQAETAPCFKLISMFLIDVSLCICILVLDLNLFLCVFILLCF